jgi:hypothetical protein
LVPLQPQLTFSRALSTSEMPISLFAAMSATSAAVRFVMPA